MRRGYLQIAEEQIARRVAAAQEARRPTQVGADQGEPASQRGQRRAQRVSHSRVVVEIGQAHDQRHRQARQAELAERFRPGP